MSSREFIEPHKGHKRYARGDEQGHFTEKQIHVGKSLAAGRRTTAKTTAPRGHGKMGGEKRN
jgi:hypothetical protein